MSNASLGGGAISSVIGGTGITVTGGDTVNLDTPVDETDGGTGQTAYTTGDILYASASNTLSKLPIGSAGEVLTVNTGVPAWDPAAGGGSWNYLASASASASASLDFTSVIDGTYNHHVLVWRDGVHSASGGNIIRLELSTDNGSSWITSGYQSGYTYDAYNAATWANSSSTAGITTTFITNSTAGSNNSGILHLYNLYDSGSWVAAHGQAAFLLGSTWQKAVITGSYQATSQVDAFRVIAGSGTMTTGEYILYGISEA